MNLRLADWLQFIKERFDPLSHILMISLFFIAHYLVTKSSNLLTLGNLQASLVFAGVFLFFLKLRFYDEIKDYELDVIINPTRPLPRGLLTTRDLKKAIILCIITEITVFALCGLNSLITALCAILYSLIMYKEFFIPKIIRPHLTTYAMSHTVVTILLSFTIFSSLTNTSILNLNQSFIYFSLMSWFLFNIFEFGRKIFNEEEERDQVESYSKVFSRTGACILVLSQVLLASFCAKQFMIENDLYTLTVLMTTTLLMLIFSIYFLIKQSPLSAKLYRGYSSGYIVLNYLFIIINYLIY